MKIIVRDKLISKEECYKRANIQKNFYYTDGRLKTTWWEKG